MVQVLLLRGFLDSASKRDVARGVLVDERVVEDRLHSRDPALAIDKRNLAEAGCPGVALRETAQRLGAPLGIDPDRSAALKPHRQAGHETAGSKEGLG